MQSNHTRDLVTCILNILNIPFWFFVVAFLQIIRLHCKDVAGSAIKLGKAQDIMNSPSILRNVSFIAQCK